MNAEALPVVRCHAHVIVRLSNRALLLQPLIFHVTTLAKSFTHTCLCQQAV